MPRPNCFKDLELSCDWNKYSTPQKSRELIGKEFRGDTREFKQPSQFFIARLTVQEVLNLKIEQQINHTPQQYCPKRLGKPNNRAHSDVKGDKEKDEQRRLKLAGIAKWEIYDKDECLRLRKNEKEEKEKAKNN
jgi:hypothetical protein